MLDGPSGVFFAVLSSNVIDFRLIPAFISNKTQEFRFKTLGNLDFN
jgi:hypothetical protein